MSGNPPYAPPEIFPAVRFKAVDYVFENSTRLKVMMDLLALPAPYLIGTGHLYPHSGHVQPATYRTPWVGESVIPTCTLVIGDSSLEDLGGCKQTVISPERFSLIEDSEVILSSNPDSLVDLDLDDDLLKGSHLRDSWQEFFVRLEPENKSEDLLLPEELMTPDHLPQLRHLPTLKAKLSRLRVLLVADPLLGSMENPISADPVFSCLRHCASFVKSSDVDSGDAETCARIHEEFLKESLLQEESLLLPAVVETLQLTTVDCSAFSALRGHMTLLPEVLSEQHSVLDVLHQASLPNGSVDVSHYDVLEEADEECRMSGNLKESELAVKCLGERLVLPTETELDVTLSPTADRSPAHICLSTSVLHEELLSPFGTMCLVSARARQMEVELWKAEKHQNFVLCFLLSEPPMDEAAEDFQPLCEALTTFQLHKQSVTGDELQPQVETSVPLEAFTVPPSSERAPDVEGRREEFSKVPPEPVEDQTPLQEEQPHSSFAVDTVKTTNQEVSPAATISTNASVEKLPGAAGRTFTPAGWASRSRDHGGAELRERHSEPVLSNHSKMKGSSELNAGGNGGPVLTRRPREKDSNPLSTFMALLSQQDASVTARPQSPAATPAADVAHQTPSPRPPPEETHTAVSKSVSMRTVVSGNATREQKDVTHRTDKLPHGPVNQPDHQGGWDSRVVQVPATDSQQQAYQELLAVALPCLHSATERGLNFTMWGDFSCLAPDQTHFLLKQQERALCRTPGSSIQRVADQELLFKQAALIHVLVTFKELLLKCNLTTALEYLTKAACAQPSLEQLLKRLQIILYLSRRNQEPNHKVLQLQQLLAEWLDSSKGPNITGKVLVIISADCEDNTSVIINSLKNVTSAVMAICPEAGVTKTVVSSVCGCVCAVVSEQHVGPDFPWSCFCLLVEYDHPGPSPWASVCRERSISHLTFNTCISDPETQRPCWRLQDRVPFVLFVTEGLLNSSLLLQTLESDFDITVLERSHCSSLQMLGGIHNYAVITVDECTAILIQEQDELHQEDANNNLVMRLTALSLQYSCCWLILLCHDGGLSREAFNNVVLFYSSLVLLTMKSEDLDVKVLMVADVLEAARWISQICFYSLMCSDRDPLSYLSRDWLTVLPSQDEAGLSQFPCINPLVGQLMLSRASSFQWLLRAPLSQLKELLPEVPHKVLKLFSDITSLYSLTAESIQPQTSTTDTNQQPSQDWLSPPTHTQLLSGHHSTPCWFGAVSAQESFCEQEPDSPGQDGDLVFTAAPSSCFSSLYEPLQGSWTSRDPWRPQEGVGEEERRPGWSSTDRAAGQAMERLHSEHSFFKLDPTVSCSPALQLPASTLLPSFTDLHHNPSTSDLSLPTTAPWGQSQSGTAVASANYGSRCWMGQERKRSGEEAHMFGSVLTPQKKGRLSYEKVAGRMAGQTRLRLL